MEDRAVRGVPWTLLSFGVNRALTLATTVILARLLDPTDFGIVSLAVLSVGALTVFGGLGLASSLVVHQELDSRGKGTVLTLTVGLAFATAAAVVALAPAAAALFREPELRWVLSVLSVYAVAVVVASFYEALLQRELEFRARFVAQFVQSASYAVVAITAAALGAGLWSLVIGLATSGVLYVLSLLVLTSDRVRPAFDRAQAGATVRSGVGFMAQGGLAFVKQNTDYLAVGRFLGPASLGVYSMAYRLCELPYWAIADPVAKVTFPAFARMRVRAESVERSFLSTIQLVALVACPLGIVLSAVARPFTEAVFGENWLAMVTPLTVLGLWGALRPVHGLSGWLLNSLGMAGLLARVSALTLLALVPGLLLAAAFGDVTTVSLVMLGEMAVATGIVAVLVARRAEVGLGSQWRVLRPVALAAVATWLAGWSVSRATTSLPALVSLIAAVGAAATVYGLAIRLLDASLWSRLVHQGRRMLGQMGDRAAPRFDQ